MCDPLFGVLEVRRRSSATVGGREAPGRPHPDAIATRDQAPRGETSAKWPRIEEEELAGKGPLSKKILEENAQFSPVVWEHSHTVMDEEGRLKTYCVYASPNPELIREHAELLGDHSIHHIYEIGGDNSPP